MSGPVYRKSEIVGVSETSVSDAIETAIARATKLDFGLFRLGSKRLR